MSRKQFTKVSDLVQSMKDQIASSNTITSSAIPDIITFCNSPEYLNLPGQGIELYPMQNIILKIFYRGTEGNEKIELTEEEIKLCKDLGLDNPEDRGDVLSKYHNNTVFRELVLVWGRGSSKDFLASIISCYEAMKLLETPGGSPYKRYNLASSNPIMILSVASASGQAEIAFAEIKAKIIESKYFQDKIDTEGYGLFDIYLFTPEDKLKNAELIKKGLKPKRGSIWVHVGHSNSDSQVGGQIFVLILDEVATYKNTSGSSGGERILTALQPNLSRFSRRIKIKDENGAEKEKIVFDSKIIYISTPRGKDGLFWRTYRESYLHDNTLMCKLPTWCVNPNRTMESLRTEWKGSEQDFWMEYGAEFAGQAGDNMFHPDKVRDCFMNNLKVKDHGSPGVVYFAHLDPATSSHNYALIVVHRENYLNKETQKSDYRIIVDHIKYWHPTKEKTISIDEIDNYLLALKRRFFLGLVTYDQFDSYASIEKMKRNGIPAKKTTFNNSYKQVIFTELDNLIISGRLIIPKHELLMNEMLYLQRKPTPRGFKVSASKEAEIKTDDLVMALAGACYDAIVSYESKMATGRLVNTGIVPSSNVRQWNSMSGVLGVGTGQQVANALEKRRPFGR